MPLPFRSRLGLLPALLALVLVFPACDSVVREEVPPERPEPVGPVFGGVDFGQLFAAPTAEEVGAIEADWAARNTTSAGARVVAQAEAGGATLYVVEHETVVANGPSVTHYGVVRVPDGADDAPVLVVHHGGDDGFAVASLTSNDGVVNFAEVFAPVAEETVQVFPVYRSETIDTDALPALGGPYAATGDASPWDYDVDDSVALLTAALELFGDETDADRVAAIGFSRGANVAVLQGVRDDRIDAVVDYYGPTDFYNEGARQLATALLLPASSPQNQQVLGLPGAQFLLDEVLDPLRTDDDTYDPDADYGPARLAVARRSPGLFADRLPDLQVHHHYRDFVVPFTFSAAFEERVGGAAGGSFELLPYGTPPTAPLTLADAVFHAPEVTPEMRASIPVVLAFLGAELGVRGGTRVPALAL